MEHVPLADREAARDVAEGLVVGAGAGDLEIDGGDLDRRPGVDVVVSGPGLAVPGQLGAHLRLVVAERLERHADLLRGLGVELADALLGELAVVLLLQGEDREDVRLQLPADAVDLHLHLVGMEGESEEGESGS